MTRPIVVTGTDTGVGKTVFAAGLARALRAHYWKPVQAGSGSHEDAQVVTELSRLPASHIIPEAYRFKLPASPHLAAQAEGVRIDGARLTLPVVDAPLVIEGAGGTMVPLAENLLFSDVFVAWNAPVIVCARTTLGTINHSLLTISMLRSLGLKIVGIVFIGEPHADNERVIPQLSGVPSLGRLPFLDPLTSGTLAQAMRQQINLGLIKAAL